MIAQGRSGARIIGEVSRFAHPRQLMGYSGAVSSEHSSGERTRRGSITSVGAQHAGRQKEASVVVKEM
jgi:transposase